MWATLLGGDPTSWEVWLSDSQALVGVMPRA
jgi:hypothetical protein